jgi:hypothetical protein
MPLIFLSIILFVYFLITASDYLFGTFKFFLSNTNNVSTKIKDTNVKI